MDKSLSTTEARTTAALVNWNDPTMQMQIKETYGKGLNEGEWKLFVGLGVATGLNPFLREIWAVKYGANPASVFIGRDGYRRSAQNHPEYEYHFTDAVYSNDVYKVVNGEVTHEYTLKNRGDLVGAYCIVKRKNASKPAITFVDLKEYVQTFGVWKTKPATMIKKVSEAQGLRASFQELFAGTYEESENWQDDKRIVDATPQERQTVREAVEPATPVATTTARKPRAVPANVVEGVIDESRISPTAIAYNAKAKAKREEVQEQEETPELGFDSPAPSEPAAGRQYAPKITTDQTRKLYDVWGAYKVASKMPETESAARRKSLMQEMFGVSVSTSLDEEQGEKLIARIEEMTKEASM